MYVPGEYREASLLRDKGDGRKKKGWLAFFCHVNQKGTRHLLGGLLSDPRTHAPAPVSRISRGGHPYVIMTVISIIPWSPSSSITVSV